MIKSFRIDKTLFLTQKILKISPLFLCEIWPSTHYVTLYTKCYEKSNKMCRKRYI